MAVPSERQRIRFRGPSVRYLGAGAAGLECALDLDRRGQDQRASCGAKFWGWFSARSTRRAVQGWALTTIAGNPLSGISVLRNTIKHRLESAEMALYWWCAGEAVPVFAVCAAPAGRNPPSARANRQRGCCAAIRASAGDALPPSSCAFACCACARAFHRMQCFSPSAPEAIGKSPGLRSATQTTRCLL